VWKLCVIDSGLCINTRRLYCVNHTIFLVCDHVVYELYYTVGTVCTPYKYVPKPCRRTPRVVLAADNPCRGSFRPTASNHDSLTIHIEFIAHSLIRQL
jgi:hypothetical protein